MFLTIALLLSDQSIGQTLDVKSVFQRQMSSRRLTEQEIREVEQERIQRLNGILEPSDVKADAKALKNRVDRMPAKLQKQVKEFYEPIRAAEEKKDKQYGASETTMRYLLDEQLRRVIDAVQHAKNPEMLQVLMDNHLKEIGGPAQSRP